MVVLDNDLALDISNALCQLVLLEDERGQNGFGDEAMALWTRYIDVTKKWMAP